jgi:A/G-specific adenine glycosylase
MHDDEFRRLTRQQGEELYRDMPWRRDTRPYYVLVSELMLQQTQVDRVIPKFEQFIERFPDETTLARAPLAEVLRMWQGLGYNRRAKFLHEAARMIVKLEHFPQDEAELMKLPGVGKNTAGAIRAYAFNQPAIFIETNVRAVYIHHFFANSDLVDDKQIIQKMKETVPWAEGKEQPDERIYSVPGAMRKTAGLSYGPKAFYWSLMDYGSYLKSQGVTPNRSRHYKKQAPLKGSIREVRGQILTILSESDTVMSLLEKRYENDDRFNVALDGLINDGLVMVHDDEIYLTK